MTGRHTGTNSGDNVGRQSAVSIRPCVYAYTETCEKIDLKNVYVCLSVCSVERAAHILYVTHQGAARDAAIAYVLARQ